MTILLAGLGREAKSTWEYLTEQTDLHPASLARQLAAERALIWLADEKPLEEIDQFWKNLLEKNLAAGYLQLTRDKAAANFGRRREASNPLLEEPRSLDLLEAPRAWTEEEAKSEARSTGEAIFSAGDQTGDQPNEDRVSSEQASSDQADSDQADSDQAKNFDLIIRSPGIPQKYLADTPGGYGVKGAAFSSNTQMLFDWVADQSKLEKASITTIGITGTKGKSTTTAIMTAVLEDALGKNRVYLGGNIGIPPLEIVTQMSETLAAAPELSQEALYVVLELSCHQLSDLTISPNLAVIQAITPEHLDYYDTVEEYVAAKSAITRYQTARDTVVYFEPNARAGELARLSPGKKIAFSRETLTELAAADSLTSPLLDEDQMRLKGSHNVINALPALVVAHHLGLKVGRAAAAARHFPGLPYRLQHIATVDGVNFYNDSLATTPESAAAAIGSFPDESVILLAGGHERNLSFEPLAQAILDHRVKALSLFPITGKRITAAIEAYLQEKTYLQKSAKKTTLPPSIEAHSMIEALDFALTHAQAGDTVLLSPGCPSFGVFKDYADRGNQFNDYVMKLKSK